MRNVTTNEPITRAGSWYRSRATRGCRVPEGLQVRISVRGSPNPAVLTESLTPDSRTQDSEPRARQAITNSPHLFDSHTNGSDRQRNAI